MTNFKRPLPLITPTSKVFYEGCKNGTFLYTQCKDCNEIVWWPRPRCQNCYGENIEWEQSQGKGKINTYTVCYAGVPPAFAAAVPYVLAIVELDEGFKVMTNIVECDFNELHCGMPVEVIFETVNDDIALPMFRPGN